MASEVEKVVAEAMADELNIHLTPRGIARVGRAAIAALLVTSPPNLTNDAGEPLVELTGSPREIWRVLLAACLSEGQPHG